MQADQGQVWPDASPECAGGCMLAIVGSRFMRGNAEAEQLIRNAFDYHRPRHFVSGGEPSGIDLMAEEEADRRGIPKTIYYPKAKGWPYYKVRDEQIALDAECLVRIFSGTAKTYGSGYTANFAQQNGAKVWRHKVGQGPARY